MSFGITSPVTGGPQTGFTTPTYTWVADTSPDSNAKQVAVTALGGTQAGVTAHSVAAPFTTAMWRPKVFQALGKPNPSTGLIANVPNNDYKVITRKGVLPLAGQPYRNAIITTTISVPAGSDIADAANLKAMVSMHTGSLWQVAAGIGDTVLSGIL
jgi:hypothetical protein